MNGLKNTLKLGLIVVVVAGLAMSGLALAQSTSDAEPQPLEAADQRAIARLVEMLSPLVDDGTITEQQAIAVAERIAAVTDRPKVQGAEKVEQFVGLAAELLGLAPADLVLALAGGETLTEIAASQGSSPEALAAALLEATADRVGAAVEDGNITEERAGDILSNAEARIDEFISSEHPVGDRAIRRAKQAKAKTERNQDRRDAVLDLLAMTPEELKVAIVGKSLAEVAAAQGVAVDTLVEALVAPVAEALGDAVAAGKLTQAEADERLAKATAHAEEVVNKVHQARDRKP